MKSTTISLDDDLQAELDQLAESQGVTVPDLVCQILKEKLSLADETPRIFPWAGKFASDGTIGGADIEEFLAAEFTNGPTRSS